MYENQYCNEHMYTTVVNKILNFWLLTQDMCLLITQIERYTAQSLII